MDINDFEYEVSIDGERGKTYPNYRAALSAIRRGFENGAGKITIEKFMIPRRKATLYEIFGSMEKEKK